MIYTVDKAALLAAQLKRFRHGYAHHLAGQFSNLDFWMTEVESALAALDGHRARLANLRDAQTAWIDKHQTQVPVHGFCGICGGKCEFDDGSTQRPPEPKETASREKAEARRDLVDATYYLLVRFHRMGLLDDTELDSCCQRIGTSVDPADIATEA